MIKRTLLAFALCAGAAHAQSASRAGEFERGFGGGAGAYEQPIEAGTRDANGNRAIVNGRIDIEGTLSGGLMDGFGSGLGSAAGRGLGFGWSVGPVAGPPAGRRGVVPGGDGGGT